MAIFTLASRVQRAIDFVNNAITTDADGSHYRLYWCIGDPGPWADGYTDSNPPVPNIRDTMTKRSTETQDHPERILFYKRSETPVIVRPKLDSETYEDDGTWIQYRGTYWKKVAPGVALAQEAHWVYLETSIEYEEVSPDFVYRIVGLFSGCSTTNPSKIIYPDDSNPLTPGFLEVLDYRKPVYRSTDQREILNMILEF